MLSLNEFFICTFRFYFTNKVWFCYETYSGPVNESVCPGIQLMLSLSRLLERQQEELPQIYGYLRRKYHRIWTQIFSSFWHKYWEAARGAATDLWILIIWEENITEYEHKYYQVFDINIERQQEELPQIYGYWLFKENLRHRST